MSAKVQQNKAGKWCIVLHYEGQRKSAVAPDKRTAEATAREINRRILEGTYHLEEGDQIKTVSDYALIFLAHTTIKPSTKSDYISILKTHINPAFGDLPVDSVTRLDVKNFLKKKLMNGLAASTVQNIKACLCNVFDVAFDDGVIPQNPATRLGRIAGRAQKAHTSGVKPKFLTATELTTLLDTFQKHRPGHYPFALLLARTGMRVGEAVALQWQDIDFEQRIIHVRRSKSRTVIDTPKSGKSREVDMSKQLADALLKVRKEMITQSVRSGQRSKWVFPGQVTETMDATAWRRRTFDVMVKLAGLSKMRVHDLRHTYASLMLANGQPLIYVQRQLGHHSIQITADTYSHLIPKSDRGAADSLDDDRMLKDTLL
jgi:integrase